jgi:hypothetical protein
MSGARRQSYCSLHSLLCHKVAADVHRRLAARPGACWRCTREREGGHRAARLALECKLNELGLESGCTKAGLAKCASSGSGSSRIKWRRRWPFGPAGRPADGQGINSIIMIIGSARRPDSAGAQSGAQHFRMGVGAENWRDAPARVLPAASYRDHLECAGCRRPGARAGRGGPA